jgi:hypothetical protein
LATSALAKETASWRPPTKPSSPFRRTPAARCSRRRAGRCSRRALLQQAARRGRRADRDVAYLLDRARAEGLHLALGFSSVPAYAVARGYTDSAGKAYDLLAIVKRLARLPRTRAAFDEGELGASKAYVVCSVATPEDEEQWLAWARTLSVQRLRRKAQGASGLPERIDRTFEFEPEDWAVVEAVTDQAIEAAAAAGETIDRAKALARVCRAGGGAGDAPPVRVVLYECASCEEATIETRDGPEPVSPVTAAAARCDAELVDVRGEPKPVTRTVPPTKRRQVLARARGRCEVPGCPNVRHLQLHHEGGRANVGHDLATLSALCFAHHEARHRELLAQSGDHGECRRFTLADGTDVAAETVAAPVDVDAEPAAIAALRTLQLPAREARALVARAKAAMVARGEALSAEELVRQALILLPPGS